MKKLRYFLEYLLVSGLLLVFSALKTEQASNLGGWLGRTIGPHLGASKKALKNLESSLPGKSAKEYAAIIRGMWDNLGRIAGEYPHLQDIIFNRCEIVNEENLTAIGKDNPAILIGAHQANWELPSFYLSHRLGWPTACIYRTPNNPYVATMLEKMRNAAGNVPLIAKSKQGARDIVRTMRKGERLAILIDQKYNQGIPVEFFGRPAMTSPAFVQLARGYNCPIVPLQVERLPGCRFRITLHPPIQADITDDTALVRRAHAMLEDWIMQHPEQWLWLHRRWDSRALKNLT